MYEKQMSSEEVIEQKSISKEDLIKKVRAGHRGFIVRFLITDEFALFDSKEDAEKDLDTGDAFRYECTDTEDVENEQDIIDIINLE
jgi:hypothetical protein